MRKTLSKKEARLKRKIEKQRKNKEKNVRLGKNVKIESKFIRSHVTPPLTQTPRSIEPNNYKHYYFTWCHTQADKKGGWSWNEPREYTQCEYNITIQPHMDSYANCSWNEVETQTYNARKGFRKLLNKYQPLDSICDEAQQRWLELEEVSQFEELFRFRLGTNRRIWGIRIQHHFYLVWYERHHKICPVE